MTIAHATSAPVLPLVSVIVPSHSHVAFLPGALASAAQQSYGNLEIIVVDDGSALDVRAALESVRMDRPLRYVRQPQAGAAAARNLGRAHASGEYLAFLDEDDVWAPDKLSAEIAALRDHPTAGAAFSDGYLISSVGDRQGRFQTRKSFAPCDDGDVVLFEKRALGLSDLLRGIVVTSSTLVKTSTFDAVGGFTPLQSGQDVDLFFRVHQIAGLVYVARPLFSYRLTDDSISRSGTRTLHASLAMLEHFRRYPLNDADRLAVQRETSEVERHLGERLMESGAYGEARAHLRRSLALGQSWDPRTLMLWSASLLPPSTLAALKRAKRWLVAGGHV